ncbi:MAG: hypothetical protein ACLFUB_11425 [Cyclobacteriaceae bacterium]
MAQDPSLTEKESRYVHDTDFLLTRHEVNKKVNRLLRSTERGLNEYIRTNDVTFPEEVKFRAGKIAKGENYRLLPYLILDYPRQFEQQSIFALRTMFWWGHPFSVTLHLSGLARASYLPALIKSKKQFDARQVYLYTMEDDPWQHHFSQENYTLLQDLSDAKWKQILDRQSHIKLATFMPLKDWNHLPEFAINFFEQALKALKIQP